MDGELNGQSWFEIGIELLILDDEEVSVGMLAALCLHPEGLVLYLVS